jgi:hypothetical protein
MAANDGERKAVDRDTTDSWPIRTQAFKKGVGPQSSRQQLALLSFSPTRAQAARFLVLHPEFANAATLKQTAMRRRDEALPDRLTFRNQIIGWLRSPD